MVTTINDKATYDEYAKKYDLSLLQSWEWAEVKKPNWQPLRLLIDGYPVSILIKKLPYLKQKFGYIPRAFISRDFSKDQFGELFNYIHKHGLSHIILDPDISNTNTQDTLLKSRWQKLGHTIQPQNTNIISLKEGEADVFARMSGNYRKKIRRAVKHGCEVEILTHANAEAIDRFYRIMDEIYHRTKFIMSGKDYFEKIWNTFGPLDKARILIVKHNGIDVGSIMYLYYGDVAYELYGGTGDAGRSIMANYLLKWEGIKLAIKLGKKSYDQWGVAPKVDGEYDIKHPLANISKFKSGFGGVDVEFLPQFVKVFNPLAYLFYRMGLMVNGLKLKLRKL